MANYPPVLSFAQIAAIAEMKGAVVGTVEGGEDGYNKVDAG
jgi:hypothetical protein